MQHRAEYCPIPLLGGGARASSSASHRRAMQQPTSAWLDAPSVILCSANPFGAVPPTVQCANAEWRTLFRYTSAAHYGIYGKPLSALVAGPGTSLSLDTAVRCCSAIPTGVAASCSMNLTLYRADESEVRCTMIVQRFYARCMESASNENGESILVTMECFRNDGSDAVSGKLPARQEEVAAVPNPPSLQTASDGSTSSSSSSCAANEAKAKARAVCPVVGAMPRTTRCVSALFPATAHPSSAFPANAKGAPQIAAAIVTRSNPCIIVAVNDAWTPFFNTHAPKHSMPTRENIVGCSAHCLGSVLVRASDLDVLEQCSEQRDWGWNEEVQLPLAASPHIARAAARASARAPVPAERSPAQPAWLVCTQFEIAAAGSRAGQRFQLLVVRTAPPPAVTKAALKLAKRREAQARYRTKNKLAIAACSADVARSIEAVNTWLALKSRLSSTAIATNGGGVGPLTRDAVRTQYTILCERHARIVTKPKSGGAKSTKRKASSLASAAVPSQCKTSEPGSTTTQSARARRRPSTDGQRRRLLALQEVARDFAVLRDAVRTIL